MHKRRANHLPPARAHRMRQLNSPRPCMQWGKVHEVILWKHKKTGNPQGCAFVLYDTREEAEQAISELDRKMHLPGASRPLEVRPASKSGCSSETSPCVLALRAWEPSPMPPSCSFSPDPQTNVVHTVSTPVRSALLAPTSTLPPRTAGRITGNCFSAGRVPRPPSQSSGLSSSASGR